MHRLMFNTSMSRHANADRCAESQQGPEEFATRSLSKHMLDKWPPLADNTSLLILEQLADDHD